LAQAACTASLLCRQFPPPTLSRDAAVMSTGVVFNRRRKNEGTSASSSGAGTTPTEHRDAAFKKAADALHQVLCAAHVLFKNLPDSADPSLTQARDAGLAAFRTLGVNLTAEKFQGFDPKAVWFHREDKVMASLMRCQLTVDVSHLPALFPSSSKPSFCEGPVPLLEVMDGLRDENTAQDIRQAFPISFFGMLEVYVEMKASLFIFNAFSTFEQFTSEDTERVRKYLQEHDGAEQVDEAFDAAGLPLPNEGEGYTLGTPQSRTSLESEIPSVMARWLPRIRSQKGNEEANAKKAEKAEKAERAQRRFAEQPHDQSTWAFEDPGAYPGPAGNARNRGWSAGSSRCGTSDAESLPKPAHRKGGGKGGGKGGSKTGGKTGSKTGGGRYSDQR
jgi:hypothetical protein